jgi:Tfp pilus assembly protein PilN
MALALSPDLRKLLAFGSGVGIQVGASDLEVAAARVRPTGIHVLGRCTIPDYVTRPAGVWGAEYARLVNAAGMGHLSATVLLPRHEVIVRHLMLPGVPARDLEGAIRLQLDTLHPYGDASISWGWSPLGEHAALIGIVRSEAVERYIQLFAEAGIPVASFTFSAAVVHAALRLNGAGAKGSPGFVAVSRTPAGTVEVYGESPARPVFSAEFQLAPERAAALALSELRLPPETEPRLLEALLPKPETNPVENDLSRNALPYAAALAGACPRLAPSANVLPAEHRRSSSRALFVPTMVLAVLLIAALAGIAGYSRVANHHYLEILQAQTAQLEPQARRAQTLDQEIERTRARARLLDQFRGQTQADLDALKELTTLLAPPAWANSINLTRDQARISGEAPQAAPLLRTIDASPLFENSEFIGNIGRGNGTETFQMRTNRETHP